MYNSVTITTKEKRLAYTDIEISHSQHALITLNFLTVLLIESLNAFTLLKSVDSGKLFQALITLHAKKRLLAECVCTACTRGHMLQCMSTT